MGRKNKRRKSSYSRKMKISPKKLIMRQQNTYDVTHRRSEAEHFDRRTDTELLDRVPQRGDIWFVELGCHSGTSVQDGCRPAFIMSNDTANLHSGIVTVVPLTSKLKKSYLPTHVILADECPALEPSMVLGEQLTTVGKTSLKSYVGRISSKKVHEIEKAVEAHLGLALSSTG